MRTVWLPDHSELTDTILDRAPRRGLPFPNGNKNTRNIPFGGTVQEGRRRFGDPKLGAPARKIGHRNLPDSRLRCCISSFGLSGYSKMKSSFFENDLPLRIRRFRRRPKVNEYLVSRTPKIKKKTQIFNPPFSKLEKKLKILQVPTGRIFEMVCHRGPPDFALPPIMRRVGMVGGRSWLWSLLSMIFQKRPHCARFKIENLEFLRTPIRSILGHGLPLKYFPNKIDELKEPIL